MLQLENHRKWVSKRTSQIRLEIIKMLWLYFNYLDVMAKRAM